MAEGRLNEKANQRFDATALAAIARIFAREAALKVAQEGLRWIVGAAPAAIRRRGRFRSGTESFRHPPRPDRTDCGYGFCCRRALRPDCQGRRARRLGRSRQVTFVGQIVNLRPIASGQVPHKALLAGGSNMHGHSLSSHRNRGSGRHSARCSERTGVLEEHHKPDAIASGSHTGPVGPGALL